jgi:hypothetical protein
MTVRITNETMAKALRKSHGNLKLAAEMIGCNRETIRIRAASSKKLQDIIHEERASILDIAESALYNRILDGDMRAIEFTLRTIGKDRGYVEKRQEEITGKDGGPIESVVIYIPDNNRDPHPPNKKEP